MSRDERAAGRHQLRVWLKLAIETGVLDRVPPRHDPDGSGTPLSTHEYARALLAELKDPESSDRLIGEILADARRFREWVEYRQKLSRKMILGHWDSAGAAEGVPEARRSPRPDRGKASHRRDAGEARPKADLMWDDWLDG